MATALAICPMASGVISFPDRSSRRRLGQAAARALWVILRSRGRGMGGGVVVSGGAWDQYVRAHHAHSLDDRHGAVVLEGAVPQVHLLQLGLLPALLHFVVRCAVRSFTPQSKVRKKRE